MRKIEVALSPDLYQYCEQENTIVVVIDVLRATSAICAAFEQGVESIIPVASVDKAKEYKANGYLVGAERNGQALEGFDFGNSPYSYISDKVIDKEVVLTTTNGTKAIEIAKNADILVVGAFTNISSLCNWLLTKNQNIVLLCSGWKGMFNLEDSMFAGAVTSRLIEAQDNWEITDAGLAAKHLFESANKDPMQFLSRSSHRRRLHKLKLKQDIKYCLNLDKTDVIPVYKDGKLKRLF